MLPVFKKAFIYLFILIWPLCHLTYDWHSNRKTYLNDLYFLAWRIPWRVEPGRLQSMGSQSRTRLSDFTFTFTFILILFIKSFTEPEVTNNIINLHNWHYFMYITFQYHILRLIVHFILQYLDADFIKTPNHQSCVSFIWIFLFFHTSLSIC